MLLAPQAQAVNLNPAGTGQVLPYPYPTVNAGQVTEVSLTNASDRGKQAPITRPPPSWRQIPVRRNRIVRSPRAVVTTAIAVEAGSGRKHRDFLSKSSHSHVQ